MYFFVKFYRIFQSLYDFFGHQLNRIIHTIVESLVAVLCLYYVCTDLYHLFPTPKDVNTQALPLLSLERSVRQLCTAVNVVHPLAAAKSLRKRPFHQDSGKKACRRVRMETLLNNFLWRAGGGVQRGSQ
jgi:cellulose synthase/poly-beta-1,6-N-acetylglucosamine synthase-like glycosyltransferase